MHLLIGGGGWLAGSQACWYIWNIQSIGAATLYQIVIAVCTVVFVAFITPIAICSYSGFVRWLFLDLIHTEKLCHTKILTE